MYMIYCNPHAPVSAGSPALPGPDAASPTHVFLPCREVLLYLQRPWRSRPALLCMTCGCLFMSLRLSPASRLSPPRRVSLSPAPRLSLPRVASLSPPRRVSLPRVASLSPASRLSPAWTTRDIQRRAEGHGTTRTPSQASLPAIVLPPAPHPPRPYRPLDAGTRCAVLITRTNTRTHTSARTHSCSIIFDTVHREYWTTVI